MTNEYAKLRDAEIARVGLHLQLKAEATLEKRESVPMVRVCDDQSGKVTMAKADIAEKMIQRGKWSRCIEGFSAGSEAYKTNYDSIDWSR